MPFIYHELCHVTNRLMVLQEVDFENHDLIVHSLYNTDDKWVI